MDKSLRILAFVVLLSFLLSGQSKININAQTKAPLENCRNSRQFGDINVCLPTINGMTECYSNSIVKARANKLYQAGSTVLGAYLNNDIYTKVDQLDELVFDDYIFVYAPNKLQGIKIGGAELDNLINSMTGSYLKENWTELKGKIEKYHDYLYTLGKPIILESYKPAEKIRTGIFLTKMQLGEKEIISITILNVMEIKQRLICSAYTLNFDGEASIKKAKTKNEIFATQFITENK